MYDEVYTVRIRRDAKTGVAIYETWNNTEGLHHRVDGPADIERDPVTAVITKEVWIRNGNADREDGPAIIRRNAKTGAVTYSAWYRSSEKIAPPKRAHSGSKPSRKRSRPTLG